MRYDLKDHESLVETLEGLQRTFPRVSFDYYSDVLQEEIGILSFEAPGYLCRVGRKMVDGLAIFQSVDDFKTFPTKDALAEQMEQGFILAKKYLQEIPDRVSEQTIEALPSDIAKWTRHLYAEVHRLLTACLILGDMAADLRGTKKRSQVSAVTGVDADKKTVFVVHGRNETIRRAVFEFLRALGLRPLEWADAMAMTGKAAPYIGEVLEHAFNAAQAVVVLLTPEDEV